MLEFVELHHLSGGLGGQGPTGPSLRVHHGLHLVIGVVQPTCQLRGASKLLKEIKPEGSVLPALVNVGDSSKERAEDDLGMILEEVDLHGTVGEMHHHGSAGPEPGLQGGDTGKLVLFTNLKLKMVKNSSDRPLLITSMLAPALSKCSFM